MTIHIRLSILTIAVLTGCVTEPPPLPPNNPADLNVYSSTKRPRNLLAKDETTIAIEKQLSGTEAQAERAQKMEHDMGNMPGMQQGEMKMEDHKEMQHAAGVESEEKTLVNEMKKTSDEMKQTSDALKQKSKQSKKKEAHEND